MPPIKHTENLHLALAEMTKYLRLNIYIFSSTVAISIVMFLICIFLRFVTDRRSKHTASCRSITAPQTPKHIDFFHQLATIEKQMSNVFFADANITFRK